jgi:hypothetical protein
VNENKVHFRAICIDKECKRAFKTLLLSIQISKYHSVISPHPIAPWFPQTRFLPKTVYPFCILALAYCQVVQA